MVEKHDKETQPRREAEATRGDLRPELRAASMDHGTSPTEVSMINQLKRHEVQVLLQAGHTQKDIARLAKVSVRTVRRIVEEPSVEHVDDDAERTRRRIGRPSTVEPFRTLVTTLLEQEPAMLSVELLLLPLTSMMETLSSVLVQ